MKDFYNRQYPMGTTGLYVLFKTVILLFFVCLNTVIFGNDTKTNYLFCQNKIYIGGTVLNTIPVDNVFDCSRVCKKKLNCKSANFVRQNKEGMCILLIDNFKNKSCKDLSSEESNDFLKMSDPCYYNFGFNGSACHCSAGFTGEFCQITPPGLNVGDYCYEVCQDSKTHCSSNSRCACNDFYAQNSTNECTDATQVELESVAYVTRIYFNKKVEFPTRGLSVLIFNGHNASYEGSRSFDTCGNENASAMALEHLQDIENGKLLLMITSDEASYQLKPNMRSYMGSVYNSTYFPILGSRDVCYLVAYQGGDKLYESFSKLQSGQSWPDSLKAGFKVYVEDGFTRVQITYG